MIIVLKRGASPEQAEELRWWIRCHNLEVQTTRGENQTVLVVIGDASRLDESYIEDMERGGGNGPVKPGNLRRQGAKSGGDYRKMRLMTKLVAPSARRSFLIA